MYLNVPLRAREASYTYIIEKSGQNHKVDCKEVPRSTVGRFLLACPLQGLDDFASARKKQKNTTPRSQHGIQAAPPVLYKQLAEEEAEEGDSSSLALIAHFFSLVMIPYLGFSITHYYLPYLR